MSTATTVVDETDYPTSDGKPMAESEIHADVMTELIATLRGYYAGRDDVCVSGNLLVYYEQGNTKKVLAPDCFVAFGVPKRQRDLYKVWDEGQFPSVVFEITSKSTKNEDKSEKFAIYRDRWGVKEYFQFDPRGEYLSPPLQGYRLEGGQFVPMEMSAGFIFSDTLGIMMQSAGQTLMLFDIETRSRLFPPAVQHAMNEVIKRQEVEQRRREEEGKRVDAERLLIEAVRLSAESRKRAEHAEAENAKLRAELDALRANKPTS